ncbi:MAG: hypothetical protein J0L53_09400 [Spirochaetes bacterium]|nr:hypothetical protein [Spirochaetota bacterium]
MKRTCATLLFLAAVLAAHAAGKKYSGAWFDVVYPGTFKVMPSLASSGVSGKYDSAHFESPDKAVRFYIFSPQWAGETPDIAVKAGETEKTEKTEKSGGFTRRWYTITPKGEGFTRSYVENTSEDKTVRWVIGIEYKDKKSYEIYKKDYLQFKKSLKQFAD